MNKIFKLMGLALLACTLTLASCEKDPVTPEPGGDPTTTIAQGTFVENGTFPGWPIETSGLDFNNDGEIDFRIYDGPSGLDYGYVVFAYEEGGNNLTTNWDEIAPVAEGTTIDANSSFGSYGDATLASSPATQYIGFRIKYADGVHYGWAKVTISGTHADWCEVYYEKTPNTPIKAGQKK